MSKYIPVPGDWKDIGFINGFQTWLALVPRAKFFVYDCCDHLETCYFEKGTRVSIRPKEDTQYLQIEPEKGLIRCFSEA